MGRAPLGPRRTGFAGRPALALLAVLLLVAPLLVPRLPRVVELPSGRTATDFAVVVPPVRSALEPLLGPLLFLQRADRPLAEFASAVLWLLAAWTLLRVRRWPGRRRALLELSALLPGAAVLLLVLALAPLPHDRIRGHDKDWILVDTHSHTRCSHDGACSPERSLDWHRSNGFDAFFLTEHGHRPPLQDPVGRQGLGLLPPDPLILVGAEYSGTNHLTLLGLSHPFDARGLADAAVVDSAHAQGALVVAAHWYAGGRLEAGHYAAAGVDGFEIFNQSKGEDGYGDRLSEQEALCRRRSLLMVGATDYHGFGSVASVWTALRLPDWRSLDTRERRRAVVEALRANRPGEVRVLRYRDRQPSSPAWIALGPARLAWLYWRSLGPIQLLSWLGWIACVLTARRAAAVRIALAAVRSRPVPWLRAAAVLSSLTVVGAGVALQQSARAVEGLNRFLPDASRALLLFGLVGLLLPPLLTLNAGRKPAAEAAPIAEPAPSAGQAG